MRSLGCLVILVLLSGCATFGKYKAKMDGWVGKPYAELAMKWGAPTKTETFPDGRKLVVYSDVNDVQMPGGATYQQVGNTVYEDRSPGWAFRLECTTILMIDTKGIIEKWSHKGGNCNST